MTELAAEAWRPAKACAVSVESGEHSTHEEIMDYAMIHDILRHACGMLTFWRTR